MKRAEYIRFLRWFRTEICDETPLSHGYFVDKYLKYYKKNNENEKHQLPG